MMTIQITFYGVLKQAAGGKTRALDLPGESATVRAALARLAQDCPAVAPLLDSAAFVVGEDLVGADYLLRGGDDLGLLPPVSGG